jgi:hypothetical protein
MCEFIAVIIVSRGEVEDPWFILKPVNLPLDNRELPVVPIIVSVCS